VLDGKGNHSGAIHHLKQVLAVNPNFLEDGDIEKYLLAVSCRQKFGASRHPASSAHDNLEVRTFTACPFIIAQRLLSNGRYGFVFRLQFSEKLWHEI
jgi:hypothetical protein